MSRVSFHDLLLSFFGSSQPAYAIGLGESASPSSRSIRIDDDQRRARERNAYRRIQAPLLCRPAGLRLFASHDAEQVTGVAADVARVRIFSDEAFELGDRLKLKIVLHGSASTKFYAEVIWLEPLSRRAPARYDVGLHVERIDEDTASLLRTVLKR